MRRHGKRSRCLQDRLLQAGEQLRELEGTRLLLEQRNQELEQLQLREAEAREAAEKAEEARKQAEETAREAKEETNRLRAEAAEAERAAEEAKGRANKIYLWVCKGQYDWPGTEWHIFGRTED